MTTPIHKEYFYCYPSHLFAFINGRCGIPYICKGINEKSNETFWLFKQSDALTAALTEYKEVRANSKTK
ncbi:MAG: hypothetical protein VB100_14445 [Angelakisella sp.]|nr:hypothetical protein [Angelakisella sp.]